MRIVSAALAAFLLLAMSARAYAADISLITAQDVAAIATEAGATEVAIAELDADFVDNFFHVLAGVAPSVALDVARLDESAEAHAVDRVALADDVLAALGRRIPVIGFRRHVGHLKRVCG